MYTIIGKGFGLYGYLPAVIQNKSRLILPIEYKSTIENRDDIRKYLNYLIWADDISDAIFKADNIILAIPPMEQFNFIFKNVKKIGNKNLFLEKPIASTPNESLKLINFLDINKIKFFINYSFLYLNWFENLFNKVRILDSDHTVEIIWKFKAYFLKNEIITWKSQIEKGGGILNFFGIHMVAVITALDYHNCQIKKIIKQKNKIKFLFIKSNKPVIKLTIDINSTDDIFKINLHKKDRLIEIIKDGDDPFENSSGPKPTSMDRRVKLIRSILGNKKHLYQSFIFNKMVIELWKKL